MTGIPRSDIDLFTDDALANPYPLYRQLRALGPVVWLTANDMYAFPRYQEVRDASLNWEVFSSAEGVMMNAEINAQLKGITLCSDPPEHTEMRNVLGRPLKPERLREQTPKIEAAAESVVSRLVSQGTFDAATELAEYLPLNVVSDLVGLGDSGRDQMLDWAAATFDAQGPMNKRTRDSFPKLGEMVEFAMNDAVPGKLDPDGWAAELYAAAERGDVPAEKCPFMMIDYIAPSLDTTIYAISSTIYLLARNPGQWQVLREDPSLIPHAVNEALRLESPVQRFTRLVTRDHEVGGTVLPAGSRVVLLYGSANRDERKYPDPDRFDIHRKPSDHLAFGHGEHVCIGMNLARAQMRALLEALIPRVERFELLESSLALNNTLRGFRTLRVRISKVKESA
jgi:cytochrome P450